MVRFRYSKKKRCGDCEFFGKKQCAEYDRQKKTNYQCAVYQMMVWYRGKLWASNVSRED